MLGTKTVGSVLKNFTKTIDDLKKIAETNSTKVSSLNDKIINLKTEVNTAVNEKDKATNIANKLEKLISNE